MAPNGFGAQVVTYDRESCVLYKQALDQVLSAEMSDVVMTVNSGEDQYAAYRRDRDAEERLLDRFRDPTDSLKIPASAPLASGSKSCGRSTSRGCWSASTKSSGTSASRAGRPPTPASGK